MDNQFTRQTFQVLVLCTHNSARSILAEAMINHWAQRLQRPIKAYSAGSAASGRVNPLAIECLQKATIATGELTSKNWDIFSKADAPIMNAVITVCDSAANEVCPLWPGAPVQVHWGYADPSAAVGDHQAKLSAFELTRQAIGYKALQLVQVTIDESLNTPSSLNQPQRLDLLRSQLLSIGAS